MSARRKQRSTSTTRGGRGKAVFLPLTEADFRSGWALDWSPELHSSPLPAPRPRRTAIRRRHPKRRG